MTGEQVLDNVKLVSLLQERKNLYQQMLKVAVESPVVI
jgi:hypothetical protein